VLLSAFVADGLISAAEAAPAIALLAAADAREEAAEGALLARSVAHREARARLRAALARRRWLTLTTGKRYLKRMLRR